jgi:V-type H+-transporting ATPase subunit C
MATQATSDIDNLKKTCTESFKDIYSTYIHIKFLKVIIDSQMRFGSPDDYVVLLVSVSKGKEKRIHSGIIDVFAEKSKKGERR